MTTKSIKGVCSELIAAQEFLKGKEDREKKAVIHAYFEKREYEKNKKVH